jgi:CheY-like chemotaxis protein
MTARPDTRDVSGAADGAAVGPLAGRRILVVEDEYLVARDIARIVGAMGGLVLGPVARLGQALELSRGAAAVHGAILDVRLGDDRIYPLADELIARGVPIIFATGYDGGVLPERLRATPRVEKPFSQGVLERLAATVFGGGTAPAGA